MAATPLRRWAPVVVVLLLAGCDGGDIEPGDAAQTAAEAVDGEEDAAADDAAAADDTAAADDSEAAEDALCALVAGVDLEAAFDGQVTFGELDARSPKACVVPIEGADGEGLTVQLGSADVFELKLGAAEGQDVPSERLDIGQDAVLIGNADLTVLVDGDTSLRVGLSAFFEEGLLPPDEVLQEGVRAVAEGVLPQL